MEELSVVGLSQRKESNVHLTCGDLSPLRPNTDDCDRPLLNTYPFALVLRLRVLQIVCGISALVMGSVALIEERRESNLGLGIPAGGATVLAAAASIHKCRGRNGGARNGIGILARFDTIRSCCACLRSLGPTPLATLWIAAVSFHMALFVQSFRTLVHPEVRISSLPEASEEDDAEESELSRPSPKDMAILAIIQIFLTLSTLTCVFVLARIEWRAA